MSNRNDYIKGVWECVDDDRRILPGINNLTTGIAHIQQEFTTLQDIQRHPETTQPDIAECLQAIISTCLRVAEDLNLTGPL